MTHPYRSLPPEAFWRHTVAAHDTRLLYSKKFDVLPTERIATAGSCFAQEISRGLRRHGYRVMDAEPAPKALPRQDWQQFGYGIYSARYGNIYTSASLLQLVEEALGLRSLEDHAVWRRQDGGYCDAFRPTVEPEGLSSAEEVMAHRRAHLRAVRTLLTGMDLMIFTLGLTETWCDRRSGVVYPTCPGVSGGEFDPSVHAFINLGHARIHSEMTRVIVLLRQHNPGLRFILTVSPVPLVATASGRHVLQATTYSKSVLRAVAGDLQSEHACVDYFPSYEMAVSPWLQDASWEPDCRQVSRALVERILELFFSQHPPNAASPAPEKAAELSGEHVYQPAHCDELLLEQFSR